MELILLALILCLGAFLVVLTMTLLHTRDEVRRLGVGFFGLAAKQHQLVLHLEVVENAVKELARG